MPLLLSVDSSLAFIAPVHISLVNASHMDRKEYCARRIALPVTRHWPAINNLISGKGKVDVWEQFFSPPH